MRTMLGALQSRIRALLSARAAAVLAAIGAAVSWGVAGALTEHALDTSMPLPIIVIELLTAAVVLGAALLWRQAPASTGPTRGVSLGVLDPGLGAALALTALSLTSLGAMALAMGIEPALTALAAAVLLRERLGPRGWAAVALAGLGMAVLGLVPQASLESAAPTNPLGILLALGAAATGALYTTLARKAAAQTDPLRLAAAQAGIGLLAIGIGGGVIAALGLIPAPVLPEPEVVGIAMVSGVLGYALPGWLFLLALKRLPAAIAGMLVSAAPLAAVVAGVLFLGETLTLAQVLGGALILLAGLLALGTQEPALEPPPRAWLALNTRADWWVVAPTLPSKRGRDLQHFGLPRKVGVWIWSGDT